MALKKVLTGILFASLIAMQALAPLHAAAADTSGKVLIVGATGRSGPAMIDALKAAGYTHLYALVRDASTAKTKLSSDIKLLEGDVRNPASLKAALQAMQGVSYIVSALGSNTFNDPANSPEMVDYQGVRNLAEAARAAGVKQYVQVSSLGVTNPNHPLNRFGKVMDWKLKGENALRASGVSYTIVRAGGLTDEPGGKSGIRALQGDKLEGGRITRADVATVCVKALADRHARNKTFEIVAGEPGAKVDWQKFFKVLAADPRP
jgi:uncharacterized protein YbjT (DUF2867 family)